ncbi:MAG: glycosyltransferase [Candidatus Krumholzibacteriia bacterium]
MRIAFLADASLPHTVRWVNFFAGRGHDCLLLSLERGDGYACVVHELAPHRMLPRFLRYSLDVPAAGARLRAFAPDLVNAHFLPNYGWMAARVGLHPLVLTTLGSDILTVPARSPLHRWRTRWVLSRCDRVTSDAAMLSRAIAAFGFPEERILTVPLGIETGRFAAPAERPEHPIVILSTRRLDPIYDIDTLLRAYRRLGSESRGSLELRIAGSGTLESGLRRRAVDLPVRFLGWLTTAQLDRELRDAHLYVTASLSDSTSVSLLEAMAAGCFPVASDIPGNREWITHAETGLLFPCGDDAALAACLQRAAGDADLRRRAAEANRRVVSERASWENNMRAVEQLFMTSCGGPSVA